MGPYCKFCDHRCFVPLPEKTPKEILEAYGSSSIVATCARGQEFERKQVGYCFGDILRALAQKKEGESDAVAVS